MSAFKQWTLFFSVLFSMIVLGLVDYLQYAQMHTPKECMCFASKYTFKNDGSNGIQLHMKVDWRKVRESGGLIYVILVDDSVGSRWKFCDVSIVNKDGMDIEDGYQFSVIANSDKEKDAHDWHRIVILPETNANITFTEDCMIRLLMRANYLDVTADERDLELSGMQAEVETVKLLYGIELEQLIKNLGAAREQS